MSDTQHTHAGYRIGLPSQGRGADLHPNEAGSPLRIHAASSATRCVYVLALVSLAFPAALSGWTWLSSGAATRSFGLAMLALVAFPVWRAMQVLSDRRSLDTPVASGPARWLRTPGLLVAAIGPIAFGLQFFIRPIARTLAPHGSDSGIEFFVTGLGIATTLAALAPIGLLLFEFSRLRAFELALREHRDASR